MSESPPAICRSNLPTANCTTGKRCGSRVKDGSRKTGSPARPNGTLAGRRRKALLAISVVQPIARDDPCNEGCFFRELGCLGFGCGFSKAAFRLQRPLFGVGLGLACDGFGSVQAGLRVGLGFVWGKFRLVSGLLEGQLGSVSGRFFLGFLQGGFRHCYFFGVGGNMTILPSSGSTPVPEQQGYMESLA